MENGSQSTILNGEVDDDKAQKADFYFDTLSSWLSVDDSLN